MMPVAQVPVIYFWDLWEISENLSLTFLIAPELRSEKHNSGNLCHPTNGSQSSPRFVLIFNQTESLTKKLKDKQLMFSGKLREILEVIWVLWNFTSQLRQQHQEKHKQAKIYISSSPVTIRCRSPPSTPHKNCLMTHNESLPLSSSAFCCLLPAQPLPPSSTQI